MEKIVKDLSIVDIGEIKEEINELKKHQSENEKNKKTIFARLKTNKNLLNCITNKFELFESTQKVFTVYKDLSDTANGELNGKQKIDLEKYIQTSYLSQVLTAANRRFDTLSNGRFYLLRGEGTDDKRSQTALDLDVCDNYTGKVRSVKSLSGGESFKASLSLALGMSDIIQNYAGGIQLDIMFIDEGFGSLDAESLEQAICILNDLTQGERLVGIISHVAELKDVIERQIVVSKGIAGSNIQLFS